MSVVNRSGPNIDPWGTPHQTFEDLIWHHWKRRSYNFFIQMLSSDVTKALDRSTRNTAPVGWSCRPQQQFEIWLLTPNVILQKDTQLWAAVRWPVIFKLGCWHTYNTPFIFTVFRRFCDFPLCSQISLQQKILTHSYSRVVLRVLEKAAAEKKRFSVYVTESQPDSAGWVNTVREVSSFYSEGTHTHSIHPFFIHAFCIQAADGRGPEETQCSSNSGSGCSCGVNI